MKSKPTKWLAWVLAVCFLFLNPGCAIFHPKEFAKEDGYYLKHFYSCGPDAIQDALLNIERKFTSRKSISKEIQATGNTSRFILASINHDALEITFPCEIKKYFNSKGYEVTKIDFESLKDTDVAIILIKGEKFLRQWHWVTYPTYSKKYIQNMFGGSTSIVSVYRIRL